MILTQQFTFFLLNVLIWGLIGIGASYFFFKKNRKVKKAAKFLIIGLFASIFGGLFAFLFNGLHDLGSLFNNIVIATTFGGGGTLLALPRNKHIRKVK
jgi:hypothetical protein